MSLFDPLFLYCERTGPSFFGEPLNLLSNAVFFIAAWLLWRNYEKNHKKCDEERITLIALITLIGVGSSLFHMAPNQLTLYGDTIPIALFVTFSLYICLRRLLTLSIKQTLLLVVGFGIVNALTIYVPQPYRFNGSVSYFPCLATLALITFILRRQHHEATTNFIELTALFTVSLTFRSIDMAICPTLSFGTHFLWHICNGFMVYLLARAIRERRKAER